MSADLFEARGVRRYIIEPPLAGWVGGAEAEVGSISPGGVRIEHAGYLRNGHQTRVTVSSPVQGHMFSFEGRVMWNRLTKSKLLSEVRYTSGVRAIDGHEILLQCIRDLEMINRLHFDAVSLQRKAAASSTSLELISVDRTIDPGSLSMIRDTRIKLRESLQQKSPGYLEAPPDDKRVDMEALGVAAMLEYQIDQDVIRWVFEHDHEL